MTRRDYIKFADLIASEKALLGSHTNNVDTPTKLAMLHNIKLSIADIFANDNPRFNRQKFYRACEPKEER